MTALIVGISGIRGIIGQSLGPEQACKFGMAFGTFLRSCAPADATPRVCLGRDSRPSGLMMTAAFSSGLMATGCQVIDLGLVTTPGVALMTRHLACNGGVVITASHNPVQWNGIKFLRHDGIAFPADQVQQIHQNYYNEDFHLADALSVATTTSETKTHAVHIDTVLQLCDRNLIASKRFKVVLDSVNGAGCVVTANMLSALGCELIHLNDRPTGIFAHTPEPTAENLKDLGPHISRHHAALGFAQDPDADRLAVIDENGTYIGEEYTLALAAKYIFTKKTGLAAVNLSTSRMIDDIAAAAGCTVLRTPVGEAHVANAMLTNKCVIGGEGNGGVIDLRVAPVRDSLVGIVLILQLLAETGQTLSQLVKQIPRYHMVKTKFPCPPEAAATALAAVKKHYADSPDSQDLKVDTTDGIRIDFPDAWVQLRASNTEPIMRITAESPTAQRTQALIEQMRDHLPA